MKKKKIWIAVNALLRRREDNNRPPVTEFWCRFVRNLLFISLSLCRVVCGIPGPAGNSDGGGDDVNRVIQKNKEKCSWAIAPGRLWFVISLTFSCNNYSLFRLSWITDCFSWDNWYLWHIHDIFCDVISFVFIGQPSRVMCIAQMIIIMLANGH